MQAPGRGPPGQQNSCSGGCGAGRGTPRHDLISDPRFAQRIQFFFEPAKDTGIARLEPHDARALRSTLGQKPAHMILPRGGEPGPLADAYEVCPSPRVFENSSRSEVVTENDIRRLQSRRAAPFSVSNS